MIALKSNSWLYRAARRRLVSYLTARFPFDANLNLTLEEMLKAAEGHVDHQPGWIVWRNLRSKTYSVGGISDYVQEILGP